MICRKVGSRGGRNDGSTGEHFARFVGAASAAAAVELLLGLAHGGTNAVALGYRAIIRALDATNGDVRTVQRHVAGDVARMVAGDD